LGINDGPMWSNCLGIFIGCLIGIYIPKKIMSRYSATSGYNRISSKTVVLGNMDEEELEAIIDGTTIVS